MIEIARSKLTTKSEMRSGPGSDEDNITAPPIKIMATAAQRNTTRAISRSPTKGLNAAKKSSLNTARANRSAKALSTQYM